MSSSWVSILLIFFIVAFCSVPIFNEKTAVALGGEDVRDTGATIHSNGEVSGAESKDDEEEEKEDIEDGKEYDHDGKKYSFNEEEVIDDDEKREKYRLFELVRQCFAELVIHRQTLREINPVFKHKGWAPVIVLENVIDKIDILNIMTMTNCVKKHLKETHYEERLFDNGSNVYDGGGNNVTFHGSFIEEYLPEFAMHIKNIAGKAADTAGWRPHPYGLTFRCMETLEYFAGGELNMHTDVDSIYTLVLPLNDPREYEGGKFQIMDRLGPYDVPVNDEAHQQYTILPQLYGGVMFDSEADHAVEPIRFGKRVVMAIELWGFKKNAMYEMRPSMKRPLVRQYFHSVRTPSGEITVPSSSIGLEQQERRAERAADLANDATIAAQHAATAALAAATAATAASQAQSSLQLLVGMLIGFALAVVLQEFYSHRYPATSISSTAPPAAAVKKVS